MDRSRQLFDAIGKKGCKSNAEVSNLLEKMDAKEVNKKNRDGWTAFHQACKGSNEFAIQKLLAFPGIHVNARNKLGCTPLLMVFGKASPASFKFRASRIKRVLKLMLDDPRVELNAVSRDGTKLEDTFEKYKEKEPKQYANILKMIKDAKQGRENKQQKNENYKDVTLNVEANLELEKVRASVKTQYIDRIETTNNEIAAVEKKSTENKEHRKLKIKDMQEEQDLELTAAEKKFDEEIDNYQQMKVKLEQQLAEVQELKIKSQDKKAKTLEELKIRHNGQRAILHNESKLEYEEEQKYLTKLKEMKNQLSKDLKRHSSDHLVDMKGARETLECPVCMESMKPPTRIWMCQSTHLICEPCKGKLDWLKRCPTCRTGGVSLRAFMAEKIALTLFPEDK